MAWSSDDLLVSASVDQTMRVWHASSLLVLRVFLHADIVTSVVFHPVNAQLVLSGCLDGHVRLFDLLPPDENEGLMSEVATMGSVTALALSEDGKTLVVGLFEGKCLFYDVTVEHKKIEDKRGHKIVNIRSSRGSNAKAHKITGLQYLGATPYCRFTKKRNFDARLLVTTVDSRVRLYNVADMSLICKYKGHVNTGEARLKAAATLRTHIAARLSTDMRFVASASEDGSLYVWTAKPPAPGLFPGLKYGRSRHVHPSPLALNLNLNRTTHTQQPQARSLRVFAGGDSGAALVRFASAVGFLPYSIAGGVCSDGASQLLYRFLVVGMSNGDVTFVRISEPAA